MKIRTMCVAVVSVSLAGSSFAQTTAAPAQPEKQPAPAPTPAPTPSPAPPPQPGDPMSGPKVEPKAGAPTLIKHDMNGRLQRPDIPPEEAALSMIGLDEGEKAAVDAVLSQRAAVLDKIVSENLPLLLKVQGVRRGDTQKEQLQAIKDLYKAFEPLRAMGSLRQQALLAMAPEKAAKYNQILNEYWQALFQEAVETEKIRGKTPTESEVRGREALLMAGQEIHRSYDRQVAAKAQQLNELLATIKASPEQDAKIKALAADYAQKTLGKPTPAQKRELVRNILKELDDDQRIALLKELYTEKPAPEKEPEEKKPDEKK